MKRLPSTLLATFLSSAAVLVLVLLPVPLSTIPMARAQYPMKHCSPNGSRCSVCYPGSIVGYTCDGELTGLPGFCSDTGSSDCYDTIEECGDSHYCSDPLGEGFGPCESIATCYNAPL